MKRIYLIEVEIDEAELASINARRKALGRQLLVADDAVDNTVCEAVNSKLMLANSCKPYQPLLGLSPSGDGDANL